MRMHLSRHCGAVISVLCLAAGTMACSASDDGQGQGAQEVTQGGAPKSPAPGSAPSASAHAVSGLAVGAEAHTATVLAELAVLRQPTLIVGPIAVDQVGENGPGEKDSPLANADIKLGELHVVTVDGADDDVNDVKTSSKVSAEGKTSAADVSLLDGLVKIRNLAADAECEDTGTGKTCRGSASVGELTIGGKTIDISGSIAPNTKLDVQGELTIAALNVNLPVDFELILNEQVTFDVPATDTKALIVNVVHLFGAANIDNLVALFVDITVGGPEAGVTGGTCNSGSLQCCNSIQSLFSDNSGTLLSGLVPVNLQDVIGSVGLDCSPINVLGSGAAGCTQATACCSGDSSGAVTLSCNPINLNL